VSRFSQMPQAVIRWMASEEPGPGQMYALQARKRIEVLWRTRLDITIDIRWCPAHKGVTDNEKAGERAKFTGEKPDARGVEYLCYPDKTEARATPLPRSLAHLKREISEKKWANARQWAGGRAPRKKYKIPDKQKSDSTVADSSKRPASRFYQLKSGHRLTGQYLNWTKSQPTAP